MIKKPFFKGRGEYLFYRTTELFFYVEDNEIKDPNDPFANFFLPIVKSVTLCIEVLGKVRGNQPILQDYIRIRVDDKSIGLSDKIKEYYKYKFPIADIEIIKA